MGSEFLGQTHVWKCHSTRLKGLSHWRILFIKSDLPTVGKNRHSKINSCNWTGSREKALAVRVEAKASVRSFHDIRIYSACIYPARRPKQDHFTKMRPHKKDTSCIMSIPFLSFIYSRHFPPENNYTPTTQAKGNCETHFKAALNTKVFFFFNEENIQIIQYYKLLKV